MKVEVHSAETLPGGEWDRFVAEHPKAGLYHSRRWGRLIRDAYGHRPYYVVGRSSATRLEGILPLVHMKSLVFGNRLVSIPFFDAGGVLARSPRSETALVEAALGLARKFRAARVEIRQSAPLFREPERRDSVETRSHKVRMLLPLPASPDALMAGFKSKLRSQIRKPTKEGFRARVGSMELMDDFYSVFVRNMRDLGSPVHSRGLVEQVVRAFPDRTRIVVVYASCGRPAACGLVIGFRRVMSNPWASALREYSRQSPNMLLYWTMLSHAVEQGCRVFDFGRSTPDEGTYRFKRQWGAEPESLSWYSFHARRKRAAEDPQGGYDSGRFDRVIDLWKRMPVAWSRWLGPRIRRQIDL